MTPTLHKSLLRLRPNKQKGVTSPHKIALLLAVAQLYELGVLAENRIEFTPELVATFHKMGQKLAPNYANKLLIHMPVYHLQSSGLWFLKTSGNISEALTSKHSPKSLNALMEYVDYAYLAPELYRAMLDPVERDLVRKIIIDKYFPKSNFRFEEINAEVKPYLQQQEFEFLSGLAAEPDEMIYETRSSLFKQQVPKLYNYQCAISGYKMASTINASLLDACHIEPWSQNHLDTIQNGISLTPTLHRAFDRHLISISEDYRVIVSPQFEEFGTSPYSILQFKDKRILLPAQKAHWPDQALLAKHRNNMMIA
jgi:putative restriction endonuclease